MVKIIIMVFSVVLILFGWNIYDQDISIIGAVIFNIALLIDLYKIYLSAKLYQDNKDYEAILKRGNPILKTIDKIIEGTITTAGLVLSIIFKDKETIYLYPCLIIFFGTILSMYLGGVIVSQITNIPLRFGYGGWEIKNVAKRKMNRKD